MEREAEAAAARQQAKIDARAAEERGSGKRRRGRKPKPATGSVDPARVANPTDPDSRIMKTRRGWVQGYNVQAVVTPQQIILVSEVTTEANDVQQLRPMLTEAQAMVELLLGEDALLGAAAADTGYRSDENAASQTEECELFIHGRVFQTIDDVRDVVRNFAASYNAESLIEKNGYLSPLDARTARLDTPLRRAASCNRVSREPGAAHRLQRLRQA